MPQSQTADQPIVLRGRDTEHDSHNTFKVKQHALPPSAK